MKMKSMLLALPIALAFSAPVMAEATSKKPSPPEKVKIPDIAALASAKTVGVTMVGRVAVRDFTNVEVYAITEPGRYIYGELDADGHLAAPILTCAKSKDGTLVGDLAIFTKRAVKQVVSEEARRLIDKHDPCGKHATAINETARSIGHDNATQAAPAQ